MHNNLGLSQSEWLCCQIGAREHYAVPRALERSGRLLRLFTDVWSTNGYANRFHHELTKANVTAGNGDALHFELMARVRRQSGWKLITARNDWFQEFVLAQLNNSHLNGNSPELTVFAYSYAANRIFKFARERGWRTILGQIDPGPAEQELVESISRRAKYSVGKGEPPPSVYWNQWRSECDLADRIVVNSEWSREALISRGVEPKQIAVVPLAFESADDTSTFQRQYPTKFGSERKMRVLFLGQINLRKGVDALFAAIELLKAEPVEFWFVGPPQVEIPSGLRNNERVKWFGSVPRSEVSKYYRDADLFIFPTLSDGFGITQLEAQSWKLPVVASRYCGAVVRDDVNGSVLPEVSGNAITNVLLGLLRYPQKLELMSKQSRVSDEFSLASLATSLLNL
jgi:glycosyltransferase involved in cell wall biosynthesis